MVVPNSINKDPTTRVLADGSAPKVPSMHVEDSTSFSKQCSHLNYEISLTHEKASETATSTSFSFADVTISVQSIETLECDLLMINRHSLASRRVWGMGTLDWIAIDAVGLSGGLLALLDLRSTRAVE
ncbi:hypothetical protein GH714_006283 [Hevea brasiliensis]|uniref:Uncharacterized protein n=1 Tax=Hevea brasiliensis TaxID=3981 RepID=A0A6A6L925_HEVBR|nr:hypothetical protein GH714_006283 [Hevea brasiliensis]